MRGKKELQDQGKSLVVYWVKDKTWESLEELKETAEKLAKEWEDMEKRKK